MARRARYQLDRVQVVAGDVRPSTWTFGGEPVAGSEQTYSVRDDNFSARNQWEFVVRTPSGKDPRVEVRPRTTPNVKAWAELPDRSVTFLRATKGEARGKWYCKVALGTQPGRRAGMWSGRTSEATCLPGSRG